MYICTGIEREEKETTKIHSEIEAYYFSSHVALCYQHIKTNVVYTCICNGDL